MPKQERLSHPVLASVYDCLALCAMAAEASYLVVGLSQGLAWLIGQVI